MSILNCYVAFKDPKRNSKVAGLVAACDVQTISFEALPTADLSRLIFLTDQVQTLAEHEILRNARDRVLFLYDNEMDAVKNSEALQKFNHVLVVRSDPPEEFPSNKVIAVTRGTQENGMSILDHLDHGAVLKEFQLSSSEQRSWFREELNRYIESFMAALPRPSPIYAQYATEVQDELLMNAIWDACPERAKLSRKGTVTLKPNETVQVKWAFDGSKFAIAVRDPFGTFPPELCEKYLKGMFFPEARMQVSMNTDTESGGAGLGFFMILARASAITVNVAHGKFTEVVVVLNFALGPKNMTKGPKTFQFFNLGSTRV